MTDDQRMINIIREYRASLDEPLPRWPEIEFDKRSYSRWAADEILVAVLSNPEWTVIRSVEELRDLWESYACNSYYSEANYIFEIGRDTASDILEILYAMI